MTVRLQLYDAIAQGQCYSVRPVLSAEFSNCRLHVLINRSLGDPQIPPTSVADFPFATHCRTSASRAVSTAFFALRRSRGVPITGSLHATAPPPNHLYVVYRSVYRSIRRSLLIGIFTGAHR